MATPSTQSLELRRRLAAFIRRFPFVSGLAQRVYRYWQPWRTVGAVGVVVNDTGKVLIVEHVFHPVYPWGLPGGWMGHREDPGNTVQREVLEETGLRVRVICPLLVEHTPYLTRHLDICFLCVTEPDNGPITLSDELLDYRWIDIDGDDLPLRRAHLRAIHTAREVLARGKIG